MKVPFEEKRRAEPVSDLWEESRVPGENPHTRIKLCFPPLRRTPPSVSHDTGNSINEWWLTTTC